MVIIPSHLLAGIEPDAVQSAPFTTTRPVGTGPFRFVKYLTDLYVELESNPDYFRGAPLIRRVYMKRLRPEVTVAQLESGELDLGMRLQLLDYDRLAALSHLETTTRPGIGMISVGFALDRPVVQDRRLRQAIYCAIDRKAVARTLFRGRAEAMEGIPLGMEPDARLDSYGHDLERAKRLLKASGFDPATPLRLIYDQTYPSAAQIYPIIGQQLRALGLRVQLEAMESTAFIARRYEQRGHLRNVGEPWRSLRSRASRDLHLLQLPAARLAVWLYQLRSGSLFCGSDGHRGPGTAAGPLLPGRPPAEPGPATPAPLGARRGPRASPAAGRRV